MNIETKTKVYDFFVELYKKYYKPGNLVVDITEDIDNKHFTGVDFVYNAHVATIKVEAFGLELYKIIMKPISQIDKYEFEEFFGFGRHCDGFDTEKKVIYCPKFVEYSLEEVKKAIVSSNIKNKDEFMKDLEILMLYGGYVNSRKAIVEMKDFLTVI